MNQKLRPYVVLVDFLADALGKNTEVVLHDVTDCKDSVVAIRNGHISGRQVGSSMTDLGLKVLQEAKESGKEYMAGYHGRAHDGTLLKASTYFIKDENGTIIGMLCLNTDYNRILEVRDKMKDIMEMMGVPEQIGEEAAMSGYNMNVSDLIKNNIRRVYPEYEHSNRKLTQREKMDIVSQLNDMGTFHMKGAVAYVAEAIGSSVPTIYRYLTSLKGRKEDGSMGDH